jgi:GT2 family glycosyltransferase
MEIGGFHPILLPHYLSDYEFTIRAHQKGFKVFTNPSFKLFVDESTTGLSAPEAGHFFQRLKSVISKKYKANPIYHISFILLVSPNKYKNIKMIIVDHILKAKKILSKSTN